MSVGILGIEPSLHAPEACVLPVYDIPKNLILCSPKYLINSLQLTKQC